MSNNSDWVYKVYKGLKRAGDQQNFTFMRSQIVAYFSEIKKINYRWGMIIDNYDYDNPGNCSTETC